MSHWMSQTCWAPRSDTDEDEEVGQENGDPNATMLLTNGKVLPSRYMVLHSRSQKAFCSS